MKPLVKVPSARRLALGLGLALCACGAAGGTIQKAGTGTDLAVGASWTGGTVPGSNDVAAWTGTSLGAGLTLGAAQSWRGLSAPGALTDISISGPGTLTLGAGGIDMSAATVNLTLANPVTLGSASPVWTVNSGTTLKVSGAVGDNQGGLVSLTKAGNGTLTLSGTNSYGVGGGTIVDGGYLVEDFSNVPGGVNLISAASVLQFGGSGSAGYDGGGVFGLLGDSASGNDTQSFAGLTLLYGGNIVSNNLHGANSLALNLGPITRGQGGGTVDFTNSNPARAFITTTTGTNAGNNNILGGWATMGGGSWATVDTTSASPFNIIPLPAAAYKDGGGTGPALWTPSQNITLGATSPASNVLSGTTVTINSLRFTGNSSLTINGGGTLVLGSGGLLISSADTAENRIITCQGIGAAVVTSGSGEIIFNVQDSTSVGANKYTIGSGITPLPVAITDNGATPVALTKSGPGTIWLDSGAGINNSYSGPTSIHQGQFRLNSGNLPKTPGILIDAGASFAIKSGVTFGGSTVAQDISGSGTVTGLALPAFGRNGTCHPGGTNTIGSLTFALGATFQTNSTITFDLGGATNGFNDQIISASGTLTLQTNVNIVINQTSGTLASGTYVLCATAGANYAGLANVAGTTVSTDTNVGVNVSFTGGSPPVSWSLTTDAASGHNLLLNATNPCTAPAFTGQPVDATVTVGTTTNFTVTATGGAVYQWQLAGTNLADGGDFSGVTTATLSVTPLTVLDAGSYACVVTTADGCPATSSAAALTVTPGLAAKVFVTLPGETFLQNSGNSGTVSAQAAGVPFDLQLTVVDAYTNIVTNYSGTQTVSYSGPGGSPAYTTSVTFSNGLATALATTLTRLETTSITPAIAGLAGVPSSSLTVNPGPVMQLIWSTQPGLASNGLPFDQQPVLETVDAAGNPTTVGLPGVLNVTVSLTSGSGPLAGNTGYNIGTGGDNGVVSFTGLQINSGGTNEQLTATTTGGLSLSAASLVFTNFPAPSSLMLWSDVSPDCVNAPVTFTASIVSAATNAMAGSVQFSTNGVAIGDPVNVSGTSAVFTTNFPAAGFFVIQAVYGGDDNFSSSAGIFTQAVIAATGPVISCPAEVTVYATNSDFATNGVDFQLGDPGVSDSCSATVSNDVAPAFPGNAFPIGTNAVTWTAYDSGGNTASCRQLVTVLSRQPPVVFTNADVVFTNSPGLCLATNLSVTPPGAAGQCSILIVTNNLGSNDDLSLPVGTNVISWQATDSCGNVSTNLSEQRIIVLDNEAPVIGTNTDVHAVTAPDACAAGVTLIPPAASDNCGVTVTSNAPAAFPAGTNLVTWTATDPAGNTATSLQRIIVRDVQAPAIGSNAPVALTSSPGSCYSTNQTFTPPATSDNCTVVSITNDAPVHLAVGTNMIVWTVTDAGGNTATSSQQVVVQDAEPPAIVPNPDLIVPADDGECSTTNVVLTAPAASDNCGVAAVAGDAPASYPVGTNAVIWTAADIHGNTATSVQLVIVEDSQPPDITVPDGVVVFTSPGLCVATNVDLGTASALDNCPGVAVTNDALETYPDGFSGGFNAVTWTATDAAGNTAVKFQLVNVEDNEPPTVTCPGDISVGADAGACSATGVSLGNAFVADNCEVIILTNDAPSQFPGGTNLVTWTAVDSSGNTATCGQRVIVVAARPPSLGTNADVTASAALDSCFTNLTLTAPPVNDDCSVASVTGDAPASFPVGTNLVTWVATDGYGNMATSSQSVIVQDTQAPVFTGLPAATASFQCLADVPVPPPVTANDNCEGGVPVAFGELRSSPGGPCTNVITRTWSAHDTHGNTNTFTQTITVNDTEPPVIGSLTATQNAVDVMNCAGTNVPGVVTITVEAGDNCGLAGGHPVVTLTNGAATDTAVCIGTNGSTYTLAWTVTATTAAGTWGATVTAADLCNVTTASFTLCMNPTRITGAVQLEGFAGTNRVVTFAATDGPGGGANVLGTWSVPLNFTGDTAGYTLTGVPAGTLGLSAVTDWNLRRKLPVALDVNGQGMANFTGASRLPGGDIAHEGSSLNAVILDDYATLTAAWLSADPTADITGDGIVNLFDYAILSGNWLTTGDPQ